MLATAVGIIHQRFCQQWVWSLFHKENGRNGLFQEKSRFGLQCAESSKVHTHLITRMFRGLVAVIPVEVSGIQEQSVALPSQAFAISFLIVPCKRCFLGSEVSPPL